MRAQGGQVLADARAVGSLGEASDRYLVKELESAELKGFARPVAIFTVARRRGACRTGRHAYSLASTRTGLRRAARCAGHHAATGATIRATPMPTAPRGAKWQSTTQLTEAA
jgi:hypothetical protein